LGAEVLGEALKPSVRARTLERMNPVEEKGACALIGARLVKDGVRLEATLEAAFERGWFEQDPLAADVFHPTPSGMAIAREMVPSDEDILRFGEALECGDGDAVARVLATNFGERPSHLGPLPGADPS
jgi:hypothetical protein